MTAYRAGQRVRIEWPDGSAVEGVLMDVAMARYAVRMYCDTVQAERDGATVTVLSEPRPDEPTGLGAVVEAALRGFGARRRWVRTFEGHWACDQPINPVPWSELVDPVVLSEGWTP